MQLLEIQYIDIDSLTPYENNAKIHTSEQIEEIKNSIKEFGMNDPIGVWGEENLIVEGHGRLIACKELGIKSVPVIRLDDLTDEQRRAYTLAHNQLTMSTGFDLEKLKLELDAITLPMSDFGFEDINESDMNIDEDGFDFDESEEELPPPKTKLGEIYRLGNHVLMCGDSTSQDDVCHLMSGAIADLVVTDPPYNVNVSNSKGMTIENDNMPNEKFYEFLSKAFSNMNLYLKEGGAFYVWYSSSEHINFETALNSAGLHVRQQLIWVKNRFILGRSDYHWQHEPCLYGWKGGSGHYFVYDRTQSTIIEDKPIDYDNLSKEEVVKMLKKVYSAQLPSTIIRENKSLENNLHPTMKPINLMAKLIRNSSEKSEIVLDLFGGSGSTLIACEQLNRKCYMMEYDPRYADAIIERWEKYTGRKAAHVKGGDMNGEDDS
jgi:DNA modification methylase